jgi:hypothetical protein
MQKIIVILFFLSCSISFAQDYGTIRKAERKINQKEYAKALKLLNRAEKQDYGFCGNAYLEAELMIMDLRIRLFKETNNDLELEKLLNEIDPFIESGNGIRYSTERIQMALKRYSKPELNTKIITALKNFRKDDYNEIDDYNTLILKADNGFKLKLYFRNLWDASKKEGQAYNEALIKLYTESEYYTLLNEQS